MAVSRAVATSLSAALVGVLALYPLLVYVGIGRFGVAPVAGVLAGACLARLVVLHLHGGRRLVTKELVLMCVGGVVLAAVSLLRGSAAAVLYYPVLVNAALLGMFAVSLVKPPSLVERLARLRDPELSPAAVAYTRRVTIAWVVFFAVNGGIAFYTARWTPLATWAWYNGFIVYLLIAAMFGVELLIRSVVIGKRPR
jgi:uncharacterized membrane protein